MGVFLEAAKEYAAQGWTVMPIAKGQKTPALKEWKSLETQAPTEQQLEAWFGADTLHDMAVLTGPSKLLVVDDDSYKRGEQSTFGNTHPTDLVSSTRRGGVHYFYAQDGSLGNSQSKIAAGFDTRGAGGYVIVAPSTGYSWSRRGKPAPVPADIRAKLTAKEPDLVGLDISVAAPSDGLSLLAQVAQRGFTEGEHNPQLRDLARLTYRALHTDNEQLKQQFMLNLLKALDARDATPQADSGNFLPTVQQAVQYEQARLKDKPAPIVPELSLSTLIDAMLEWEGKNTRFLIEGWLPAETLTLLSAAPESWKTWMMLDAVVTVALHGKCDPFLNRFESTEKAPVLLFQQEDNPSEVVKRLRLIIDGKTRNQSWDITPDGDGWVIDSPYNAPIFLHQEAQFSLTNPKNFEILEARIKETGAKLVAIDPFYSLMPSDNYFSEAGLLLKNIKNIRNRTGAAFLFVHHNKKSADSQGGRGGALGSTLMNGAMENAWMVFKETPTQIQVQVSGKVLPKAATYNVNFDVCDGWINGVYDYMQVKYNPVVELHGEKTFTGKYDAEVYDLLVNKGPLALTAIAEVIGAPKSSIDKSLKALIGKNFIAKEGKSYFAVDQMEGNNF